MAGLGVGTGNSDLDLKDLNADRAHLLLEQACGHSPSTQGLGPGHQQGRRDRPARAKEIVRGSQLHLPSRNPKI